MPIVKNWRYSDRLWIILSGIFYSNCYFMQKKLTFVSIIHRDVIYAIRLSKIYLEPSNFLVFISMRTMAITRVSITIICQSRRLIPEAWTERQDCWISFREVLCNNNLHIMKIKLNILLTLLIFEHIFVLIWYSKHKVSGMFRIQSMNILFIFSLKNIFKRCRT